MALYFPLASQVFHAPSDSLPDVLQGWRGDIHLYVPHVLDGQGCCCLWVAICFAQGRQHKASHVAKGSMSRSIGSSRIDGRSIDLYVMLRDHAVDVVKECG
jgi:hypothetical protein